MGNKTQIYTASRLPRWLIANSDSGHLDYCDCDFVVHCHAPRFIVRMYTDAALHAEVELHLIDPVEDPLRIAALIREACEFHAAWTMEVD